MKTKLKLLIVAGLIVILSSFYSTKLIIAKAKEDTSLGLRNVKIDMTEAELTESQKLVVRYFDKDYFDVGSTYYYEFIRRYPQIFQGSQLKATGVIIKILNQNEESFEVIVSMGASKAYGYNWEELQEGWVLLKGRTDEQWFMEGDEILFRGRYIENQNISVDGISMMVPVINGYEYSLPTYSDIDDPKGNRFTYDEIKEIAAVIFGDAITVRESTPDEISSVFTETPEFMSTVYTVVLDNQSNAKFEKYMFDAEGGYITDLSDGYNWQYSTVRRTIEFAPDFNHFLLWSMDDSLEILTVEYFDKELNQIWKREFNDTTNAVYDYTMDNMYIVANNTLNIISMSTGEDTFEPVYVGDKLEIRKVSDGILLFSQSKSDAIMKTGNDGKIEWTSNLSEDITSLQEFQIIDNSGVMCVWCSSDEYFGAKYIKFDLATGNVIQEAQEVTQGIDSVDDYSYDYSYDYNYDDYSYDDYSYDGYGYDGYSYNDYNYDDYNYGYGY